MVFQYQLAKPARKLLRARMRYSVKPPIVRKYKRRTATLLDIKTEAA